LNKPLGVARTVISTRLVMNGFLDWVAGSSAIDEIVPDSLRDVHAGLGRNAGGSPTWANGPSGSGSRTCVGTRLRATCFLTYPLRLTFWTLSHENY
jgi:hypothetical protein